MQKINLGSQFIVEDHLKKVVTMTRGKSWKVSDNTMVPRSNHSAFGDFPDDVMKDFRRNSMSVTPVPDIY